MSFDLIVTNEKISIFLEPQAAIDVSRRPTLIGERRPP